MIKKIILIIVIFQNTYNMNFNESKMIKESLIIQSLYNYLYDNDYMDHALLNPFIAHQLKPKFLLKTNDLSKRLLPSYIINALYLLVPINTILTKHAKKIKNGYQDEEFFFTLIEKTLNDYFGNIKYAEFIKNIKLEDKSNELITLINENKNKNIEKLCIQCMENIFEKIMPFRENSLIKPLVAETLYDFNTRELKINKEEKLDVKEVKEVKLEKNEKEEEFSNNVDKMFEIEAKEELKRIIEKEFDSRVDIMNEAKAKEAFKRIIKEEEGLKRIIEEAKEEFNINIDKMIKFKTILKSIIAYKINSQVNKMNKAKVKEVLKRITKNESDELGSYCNEEFKLLYEEEKSFKKILNSSINESIEEVKKEEVKIEEINKKEVKKELKLEKVELELEKVKKKEIDERNAEVKINEINKKEKIELDDLKSDDNKESESLSLFYELKNNKVEKDNPYPRLNFLLSEENKIEGNQEFEFFHEKVKPEEMKVNKEELVVKLNKEEIKNNTNALQNIICNLEWINEEGVDEVLNIVKLNEINKEEEIKKALDKLDEINKEEEEEEIGELIKELEKERKVNKEELLVKVNKEERNNIKNELISKIYSLSLNKEEIEEALNTDRINKEKKMKEALARLDKINKEEEEKRNKKEKECSNNVDIMNEAKAKAVLKKIIQEEFDSRVDIMNEAKAKEALKRIIKEEKEEEKEELNSYIDNMINFGEKRILKSIIACKINSRVDIMNEAKAKEVLKRITKNESDELGSYCYEEFNLLYEEEKSFNEILNSSINESTEEVKKEEVKIEEINKKEEELSNNVDNMNEEKAKEEEEFNSKVDTMNEEEAKEELIIIIKEEFYSRVDKMNEAEAKKALKRIVKEEKKEDTEKEEKEFNSKVDTMNEAEVKKALKRIIKEEFNSNTDKMNETEAKKALKRIVKEETEKRIIKEEEELNNAIDKMNVKKELKGVIEDNIYSQVNIMNEAKAKEVLKRITKNESDELGTYCNEKFKLLYEEEELEKKEEGNEDKKNSFENNSLIQEEKSEGSERSESE